MRKSIKKALCSVLICGAISFGVTNTTLAAEESYLESSVEMEQLSAWPRIRDAILGRNPDPPSSSYHRDPPPPPTPPSRPYRKPPGYRYEPPPPPPPPPHPNPPRPNNPPPVHRPQPPQHGPGNPPPYPHSNKSVDSTSLIESNSVIKIPEVSN